MKLLDAFRENPFCTLSAAAMDSRRELTEKQEEIALFGGGAEAERALGVLLNPQTRTEAEIQWFPHMKAEETRELLDFFDLHRNDTEMPAVTLPSVLGQFNMLRLALGRLQVRSVPALKAVFLSLSAAADALIPGQVMEEINIDRRLAGFAAIKDPSELEPLIRNLLSETAAFFRGMISFEITDPELKNLTEEFGKMFRDASSPYHNSYFLELAADRLAPDNGGYGKKRRLGLRQEQAEGAGNRFTRTFQFEEKDKRCLDKINEALAGMKCSAIRIRDSKGYIFRESIIYNNGIVLSGWYFSFESLTLECEQRGYLYTWFMEAEILTKTGADGIDAFKEKEDWLARNPKCVSCTAWLITFEAADVMVYLYH